jgi:hypothetical protein
MPTTVPAGIENGLPFGVRRQSREAAPTPLWIAPTVRGLSAFRQTQSGEALLRSLSPHSKGFALPKVRRQFVQASPLVFFELEHVHPPLALSRCDI